MQSAVVWIEHGPKESTGGGEEAFDLVVFTSYEVTERALYLGETRAWLAEATWKALDRATVESLLGRKYGVRGSHVPKTLYRAPS